MSLTSRLLLRTARSTAAQAARRRRRDLERELAAYSTPADLADLRAMLNRQDDRQTAEVRAILADQERARTGGRHLLGGGLPPASCEQLVAGPFPGWTEQPEQGLGGRSARPATGTRPAVDPAHDWRRPPPD